MVVSFKFEALLRVKGYGIFGKKLLGYGRWRYKPPGLTGYLGQKLMGYGILRPSHRPKFVSFQIARKTAQFLPLQIHLLSKFNLNICSVVLMFQFSKSKKA